MYNNGVAENGFAAVARNDARILILGSMPSRKSLSEQQYYAHPQNAFWPIMAELFGFVSSLTYVQRLEKLTETRIALWDVAGQCVRPGSMDHAIELSTVVANDFNAFFAGHTNIRAIFFNGRKAEELFHRLILPQLVPQYRQIERCLLPSTSPAHAALGRAQKQEQWQIVRQALETD